MIIQLYMEENRKIIITYTSDIKFNKISLSYEPILDFERNNRYYPKFNEKYYNLSDYYSKFLFVHQHFHNMLIKNSTSFAYITRLFDMKIECIMEFENNIQINCGEIFLSKIIFINSMHLIYNIPSDNFINSTKLFNLKQISTKMFLQNYNQHSVFKTKFSMAITYLPLLPL